LPTHEIIRLVMNFNRLAYRGRDLRISVAKWLKPS
jgi:hypothetical protein